MIEYLCKLVLPLGLASDTCFESIHHDLELVRAFKQHMADFNLEFVSNEEKKSRFQIFAKNDQLIKQHNDRESTFKLGHNQFSTWSDEEFGMYFGGHIS